MSRIQANATKTAKWCVTIALLFFVLLIGTESVFAQNPIVIHSVEAEPTTVNSNVKFLTISATSGGGGGGGHTPNKSIVIEFDEGVVMPSSLPASSITVNGTPVSFAFVSGQVIKLVHSVYPHIERNNCTIVRSV